MDVVTVQPGVPWWLDEAPAVDPQPALEGDAQADVAIVGGGYTGLWTALAVRKREPSARVVVLEAELCGEGPSGRNGGFLHGYWSPLARLRPVFGDAGALEIAEAGAAIIPGVREFAETRGVDVWLREAPLLEVSAAAARLAERARDAARTRYGRRGRRRSQCRRCRLEADRAPPDRVRLLRRPYRAGPRAARADQLDRRRVHFGRADVPPLLPDDERR